MMARNFVATRNPTFLDAEYRTATLPEHLGNPCVEALPPFIPAIEYSNEFSNYPHYTPEERFQSDGYRMQAVLRLNSLLQTFAYNLSVIDQLGLMVRAGYEHRRPQDPDFLRRQVQWYRESLGGKNHPLSNDLSTNAVCFSLFGVSGVGKTTTVRRTLSFLPQVIAHKQFGFIQLVYIKVDCSNGGRLKQLLLAILDQFDLKLGTAYCKEAERMTLDSLILYVSRKAAEHYLGLLVIDEIQHLLAAPGVSQIEMMNFFVTFTNIVKVPLLVIGTTLANKLLEGTFREARRLSDFGSIIWGPIPKGEEWTDFIKEMWSYQWTKTPVVLTKIIIDQLFDLSQGIVSVVVRLYQLAQVHAIRTGSEVLTREIFAEVADTKFKLIKPMLQALRNNNVDAIKKYEDLFTTGLNTLDKDIDYEANVVSLRENRKMTSNGSVQRRRAISSLIAMGYPETEMTELVDSLFSADPQLTVEAAVCRAIDALDKGRIARNPFKGASLVDIVADGSANGLDPLNALADAGFAARV